MSNADDNELVGSESEMGPQDGEPAEKVIPRLENDISSFYDFDDAATKEAHLFSSGDSIKKIKNDAEKRESDRAERFKDNFEIISILSIWGLFLIFGALTAIWALHLVLPENMQFLNKGQLDKLQIVITSGFVTGVASSHIKKRLS